MNVQISQSESLGATPAPKSKELSSGKVIAVLSGGMALQVTSFVIYLALFARRFTELGAGVELLGIQRNGLCPDQHPVGSVHGRLGRPDWTETDRTDFVGGVCSGFLWIPAAPSAVVFIVLRCLAGAFTAGLIPAVTGVAADLAPRDRRAQWISFVSGGASFGWIAGPIAGGISLTVWEQHGPHGFDQHGCPGFSGGVPGRTQKPAGDGARFSGRRSRGERKPSKDYQSPPAQSARQHSPKPF